MEKLLHIDFDLQQRNRVFKDGSNLLKQVTDKAKNLPFTPLAYNSTTKPIFKYGVDGIHYLNILPTSMGIAAYNVEIPYNQDFMVEVKFRLNDLSASINQMIFNHSDTVSPNNGMYCRRLSGATTIQSNMGSIDPSVVGETLTEGVWVHLLYVIDQQNNTTYHFYNGKYAGNAGILSPATNINTMGLGVSPYFGGADRINGDIMYFRVYNYAAYKQTFPIGTQVFNPKQPYFYYKRFKPSTNKVAFFSSRHLYKNSINTSDQVEKIYSEQIGYDINADSHEVYLRQETQANRPVLTNKGLKFTRANNEFTRAANDSSLGVPSGFNWFTYGTLQSTWYFGMWHMPLSLTGSQWFGGFGQNDTNRMRFIFNNAGAVYTFFNGTDILNTPNTYSINSYNYISAIGYSGLIYCFVNGIFIGTISDTINLVNTYIGIRLGNESSGSNASDCYIDDILLNINDSTYDPIGKSVGDKVFEPLSRLSLEDPFGRDLIDLRSTFGVTKDVSNNVSKTKLYNLPSRVFRATSGNEPVENGDGFEFGSGGAYMSINKNIDIHPHTNFTFDIWIYYTINDSNPRAIFGNANNITVNTNNKYQCWLFNGTLEFRYYGSARVDLSWTTDVDFPVSTWNHARVVKEGSVMYLYINGKYKTSQSGFLFGTAPNANTNPFYFGGGNADTLSTRSFRDGKLDDLKAVPYALTQYNSYSADQQVFTQPTRSIE